MNFLAIITVVAAQASTVPPPIIDMHFHADLPDAEALAALIEDLPEQGLTTAQASGAGRRE